MTFLYPYALFALLAIPVLILIYILRNKYREETDSSTYLWELSEKFLKKRNPLHRLEHLLAFIVQLLTIAVLAICVAHPVFTLKNSADNICFVLDGSASMRIKHDDNGTRFDAAKKNIMEVVNSSTSGSTFTLILAGDEARTVCSKVDDASRFEMYLNNVNPTESYNELDDSMNVAQQYFSNGTCNVCYLATDRVFEKDTDGKTKLENVNLIDVSDENSNFAIHDVTYSYDTITNSDNVQQKVFKVTTEIGSYFKETATNTVETVYFEVKVDDKVVGGGYKMQEVKANSITPVEIIVDNSNDEYSSFNKLEAEFKSIGSFLKKDSLELDNEYVYYSNKMITSTKVRLVSNKPYFLKAALNSLPNVTCDVVSTALYNSSTAGYDVTIFDNYAPSMLPGSGAVWFFGCPKTVEDTGFIVGDPITNNNGMELTYADNTESMLYNQLTKDIAHNDISIAKYYETNLTEDFTTVLSYNNKPMVFAGSIYEGTQKEVVFTFDVHDSNIVVQYDFIALLNNFITYSNPTLITKYSYDINESALFSLSDSVKAITVKTPSEKENPLALDSDYVTYDLTEVGTYVVTITYEDSSTKTVNLFTRFPREEEDPFAAANSNYKLAKNELTVKGDALFDNILPIVIAAAVLFSADWALYAHEQY